MGLLAFWAPFAMAQDEAPVARFSVAGFTVEGGNPLPADTTQSILTDFTGSHEGLDGLLAAADALESAIIAAGHSFHRVVLPPQTLSGGVVTLQVVVFRVGNVTVEGNEHFSDELVRESLPPLEAGTVPSTRELSRALRVANQHPVRQVGVKFKESEQSDTIDAQITVRDDKPWQVVSSLNNTGSEDSERLRFSIAYQHSNVWGLDHILTASYTTAPEDTGGVRQRGLSYDAPLYDFGGRLSAFYVDSNVDIGDFGGFAITGSGRFWGLKYTQFLLKQGRYNHWFSVGFDNKLFHDNTVDGAPSVPDVRSHPTILAYGGEFPMERGLASFSVSYVRNFTTGSANNQAAYEANRDGADDNWSLLRLRGDVDYALAGDWGFHGLFEGQWADTPLIGGEQYGLGGAYSVRGLEERDTTGDSGYRVSLELWAPPTPHNTRFLGFVDAGKVWNKQHERAFRVDDDFVATLGLGLRWQPGPRVNVTVDVGHALEGTSVFDPLTGAKVSSTKDGHKQVHANVTLRF